MAESKAAKLERFKNKKTQLQIQLAQIAVKKETYGMRNDGTLHDFMARRNPKIMRHTDKLGAQIRNLKKQIEMYDRKISALQ